MHQPQAIHSLLPKWSQMVYAHTNILDKMPEIVEWNKLAEYEQTDMTIGAQELACAAGFCEIQ